MMLLITLVTATFEVTSATRNRDVTSSLTSGNATSLSFSKEWQDVFRRVVNG